MNDQLMTEPEEQSGNTPLEEPVPSDNSRGAADARAFDQLALERDTAKSETAEWRDKYLRLLADFDNFRKRVRQDSELQRNLITELLLASLLPIMDDLDRMMAAPADPNDTYRRGAELIRDKLRAYLQSQNVEKMVSQGRPFDPAEHDALLTRPTADFPAGTVLEVITPGYRIGERVLRHAQVVVSETAAGEPTQERSQV